MVNHVNGAVSREAKPGFQVPVRLGRLPGECGVKTVEKTVKSDAQSMFQRRNDLPIDIRLVNDLQVSVETVAPKDIGLVVLQVDVNQPVTA